MVSAIVETLIFLIRTVLDLFFLLILMRLLFQYFKVEFYIQSSLKSLFSLSPQ